MTQSIRRLTETNPPKGEKETSHRKSSIPKRCATRSSLRGRVGDGMHTRSGGSDPEAMPSETEQWDAIEVTGGRTKMRQHTPCFIHRPRGGATVAPPAKRRRGSLKAEERSRAPRGAKNCSSFGKGHELGKLLPCEEAIAEDPTPLHA